MDNRLHAGLVNWAALASAAGLPCDGWRPRLLWSRQDANGDRTVVRLERAGFSPVVCKQAHRAAEAAPMARGVAAQELARSALGGEPPNAVPAVLAILPERAAVLIEAVDAVPLDDMPGDADAFSRTAAWLHAFHCSAAVGKAPFWPKVAAKRFLGMLDEVRQGRRTVPDQSVFLDHAQVLEAAIPGLRGRPVPVAPRHGDFSGRNVLVGRTTVWGIDFAPADRAAVVIDLAKLLAFLAERWPVPVLDSPSLDRFFAAYRIVPPDDPALHFMIRVHLLQSWAGLPAEPSRLSARQRARLRRIRHLLTAADLR